MKWSFRVCRVAGIDVRIHITFLLLPLFFGWSGWQEGGAAGARNEVVFILALFLCVLLHEFGHALAGRHYGIPTPDITLLPFGGVARMTRIPSKPLQELVIAVAGPAVNVAIAGGLGILLFAGGGFFSGPPSGERVFLHQLLTVNAGLVLFNMIPAFPMDGGRILRALLSMGCGHFRATQIAARVGQVLAVVFAVAGFFSNPMLVLIGLFVFSGAQDELAYARFLHELETERTRL
jgi:Zn-dependent protease